MPLGAHLRPNSLGSPQDRTKLAHPVPAAAGNFPVVTSGFVSWATGRGPCSGRATAGPAGGRRGTGGEEAAAALTAG